MGAQCGQQLLEGLCQISNSAVLGGAVDLAL